LYVLPDSTSRPRSPFAHKTRDRRRRPSSDSELLTPDAAFAILQADLPRLRQREARGADYRPPRPQPYVAYMRDLLALEVADVDDSYRHNMQNRWLRWILADRMRAWHNRVFANTSRRVGFRTALEALGIEVPRLFYRLRDMLLIIGINPQNLTDWGPGFRPLQAPATVFIPGSLPCDGGYGKMPVLLQRLRYGAQSDAACRRWQRWQDSVQRRPPGCRQVAGQAGAGRVLHRRRHHRDCQARSYRGLPHSGWRCRPQPYDLPHRMAGRSCAS
jgi:hypothetical protein